jgi:hypothetical protein
MEKQHIFVFLAYPPAIKKFKLFAFVKLFEFCAITMQSERAAPSCCMVSRRVEDCWFGQHFKQSVDKISNQFLDKWR